MIINILITIIVLSWMTVGFCSAVYMITEDEDLTTSPAHIILLCIGIVAGFCSILWVLLTILGRGDLGNQKHTTLFKKREKECNEVHQKTS